MIMPTVAHQIFLWNVLVPEHESCYELNIELVNIARNAGIEIDLAVWKYFHVKGFPLPLLFVLAASIASGGYFSLKPDICMVYGR